MGCCMPYHPSQIADQSGYLRHHMVSNVEGNHDDYIGTWNVKVLDFTESGGFGSVFTVRAKSGKVYAAKIFRSPEHAKPELIAMQSRRLIAAEDHWARQHHIIRLHAVSTFIDRRGPKTGTRMAFYSYCDGGDACSLIDSISAVREDVPEAFVWSILDQLCAALSFLSDTGILPKGQRGLDNNSEVAPLNILLHGDLKPDNILFNWRKDDPDRKGFPEAVLADFGLARELPQGTKRTIRTTGSPVYSPPEWPTCSPKGEVWSIAGIVHSIVHRSIPPVDLSYLDGAYGASDEFRPLKRVRKRDLYRSDLPKKFLPLSSERWSKALNDILNLMLTKEYDSRPTPQQAHSMVSELAQQKIPKMFKELPDWVCRKKESRNDNRKMSEDAAVREEW